MGIFNTYGSVQLKCGDPAMVDYAVGAVVDVPDGLYLGWGGFVAVIGGRLVGEWPTVTDTHGEVHQGNDLLRNIFGPARLG